MMFGCQPKESLPGVFVSWVVEVQIAALQKSPVETPFQYAVEVTQTFICLHESILNKFFFTAQKCSLFNYHSSTTTTQASLQISSRTREERTFKSESTEPFPRLEWNVGKRTSIELWWVLGKPWYKAKVLLSYLSGDILNIAWKTFRLQADMLTN